VQRLVDLLPSPREQRAFGRSQLRSAQVLVALRQEAFELRQRDDVRLNLLPSGSRAPPSTVYRWFARFRDDGTWKAVNHHLVMLDRERVGRDASPTAAVLDSQRVKTAEAGGRAATTQGRR
jgi:transposase